MNLPGREAFLELEPVAAEKAGNLSGGQKKLLELGLASTRKPKIILLDEIGAGIVTLLAKISDKIKPPTVNVVSHSV